MTVLHSTFTLERSYPAAPERVFAYWADPATKARWFAGPDAEHELDFRIGGMERVVTAKLRFEATYADIKERERLVYSGAMYAGDRVMTLSLTTVQFEAEPNGTRLVLTEQGTYLDGQELPAWREQGTGDWLDALGAELNVGNS
jgi:uncharacterized protein YndB with AHSA1/START domain